MSTLFKAVALSCGLFAGFGVAQAQTLSSTPMPVPGQSIANLPPVGPRASSLGNIPAEAQLPLTQSGNYPGPAPGAGTGQMPAHFEKPTGYDRDVMMHPYDNGVGPRPN